MFMVSELDLVLFLGNIALGWLLFTERKEHEHCKEAVIQMLIESGELEFEDE